MKTIVLTAAALMLAPAVFAQTAGSDRPAETATKPPPTGVAGNGVTTSTTSSPEMKTGSERSPTAGAPTSAGVTSGGVHR